MADPIPTAIETLKILIDQVPYYAQTPQAQEVIGWVNNTLDAIKQYNENHGVLQEKAKKELKNLQKKLEAAQQQIAPPVISHFDIDKNTPPQAIMKLIAKHASAEGEANIKSLGESQREIQEQAQQWQEQLIQASRSLQKSITDAKQPASIRVYGTLDPDVARQEQELERLAQSEQHGGIFRTLFRGLGMVDDLLLLPVIFAWEKIRKGRNLHPASTGHNPNPDSVKPADPGISQSAAHTVPDRIFTVPEKAVTISEPERHINGGTENAPQNTGYGVTNTASSTNLVQGSIGEYEAPKPDTTTAVGAYDPELAKLMKFAEQQKGDRGNNGGDGLNRFGKTRQPDARLPERRSQ